MKAFPSEPTNDIAYDVFINTKFLAESDEQSIGSPSISTFNSFINFCRSAGLGVCEFCAWVVFSIQKRPMPFFVPHVLALCAPCQVFVMVVSRVAVKVPRYIGGK